MRVAVIGGHGKTGRAVAVAGCDAAYVIAPNLHPDEPAWTILQPGAYLQNLDLSGPVDLPYSPDVPFGFLDLADLGRAAATVLTETGHIGATYELASLVATVRELADEAGVEVRRVADPGTHPWLTAMFAYYDAHGLPVGTRVLAALLR